MSKTKPITILGIFVADTSYRADRPPRMGETILGNSFALGPGGKGSNQAVAVARLEAPVHLITRLGDDAFAELAIETWQKAGVTPEVIRDPESYTGAAYIFIEEASGDNAIIVCPGAASVISHEDVEANADLIASSSIFMTQLEQPIVAARKALEIAHGSRVKTILNPAPAAPLDDEILSLCDYVTPNETEAAELTGLPVGNLEEAKLAAAALVERGAGAAVITLGENGALFHDGKVFETVPVVSAGPVVETTGAGDAFNAGFATALSRGAKPVEALRFGCAVAGISVTRAGTASSMPSLSEVEALLDS
ncbi:MAG: ribokinase [Rhizobiaceae bacterium]